MPGGPALPPRRRDGHGGFDGVVDYSGPGLGTLQSGGQATNVFMYGLSEGFLETLGVRPILGRAFLPEDHRPGRGPVALVRYGFWRDRLGGDPAVIGQTLWFEDLILPPLSTEPVSRPVEVIGVLPPSFVLPDNLNPPTELFVPRIENRDDDLNPRAVRAPIARLKPGVTLAQAEAELQAIVGTVAETHPELAPGRSATLAPLQTHLFRRVRTQLWILFGGAGLVLLIACVNLASLLLARGEGRGRELALRAVAGATRGRLVGQLLAESMVVAIPGGAIGLAAGSWLFALMSARLPQGIPGNVYRLVPAGLDLRVFAFTFGAALLSVIVFGLLPAARASKTVLTTAMQGGVTATPARRFTGGVNPLVVAEVALALVLCTGAGLLVSTFAGMVTTELGYSTDGVAYVTMSPSPSRYPDRPERLAMLRDVYHSLQAVPGVTSVGGMNGSPIITTGSALYVDGERIGAGVFYIAPGYFDTLGVPLLRGRDLTMREAFQEGAVALVNERAAERLWPGEDPINRFYIDGDGREFQVVGLVADTRRSFSRGSDPMVFLPLSANPREPRSGFVVRSNVRLTALYAALEDAVGFAAPNIPIITGPLASQLENDVGLPRLRALFVGVLAAMALLLAAVGIYGVVNYAVAARTREIGVRMALGADIRQVRRMVVGESSVSVAVGLALGGLGAFWATQVLASMLQDVSPRDPLVFAAAALVLAGAGLAAAYLPARRASRVDPVAVLRHE